MLSITVVFTLVATAFVVMANPYDPYEDYYDPNQGSNQSTDYGDDLADFCGEYVNEMWGSGIISWGDINSAVGDCKFIFHSVSTDLRDNLISHGMYLGFEEGYETEAPTAENTLGVIMTGIASAFSVIFSFFLFIGTRIEVFGINLIHVFVTFVSLGIGIIVVRKVLS